MTVEQVSEYTRIDEHTSYTLARSGVIPSHKIAGPWRFKKDVMGKWINEGILKRAQNRCFPIERIKPDK